MMQLAWLPVRCPSTRVALRCAGRASSGKPSIKDRLVENFHKHDTYKKKQDEWVEKSRTGFGIPENPSESPEYVARVTSKLHEVTKDTKAKFGSGPAGGSVVEDRDQATYMRSKEEKAGERYDNVADISTQEEVVSAPKKKARDLALDLNPFGGTAVKEVQPAPSSFSVPGAKGSSSLATKNFMDYVENEQDYYTRSQTESQALALGRQQARVQADRQQSLSRTTEILGTQGQQKVKRGMPRLYQQPLIVKKWDMNSFHLSNGQRVVGAMIIYRNMSFLWDVETPADITMEKMMPLAHLYPPPKFIILGLGVGFQLLHPDIHMYMRSRGTRLEPCTTEKALGDWQQIQIDRYQAALAVLPLEPTNGFDYVPYNKYWRAAKSFAGGHGAQPT